MLAKNNTKQTTTKQKQYSNLKQNMKILYFGKYTLGLKVFRLQPFLCPKNESQEFLPNYTTMITVYFLMA